VNAFVDQIARQIPLTEPDCVRVGIDGADGAGKTIFADTLAATLLALGRTVIRVSADDFHNVREVRYRRGRNSAEGFWLDAFNYPRLIVDVLLPLGPGGSRRYRPKAHDLRTDAVLDPPERLAQPGSVLVLDGLFLHRAELAGRWEFSVFLDVPEDVRIYRLVEPDGSGIDLTRYLQAHRLYVAACAPAEQATVVVANTSPEHPSLVIWR
jgi:uridine kinase